MYKIRLSDSVQLKMYMILKPEVEDDFDDETNQEDAMKAVQQRLDFVVDAQLTVIANRMTEKQKAEVRRDASADPRFLAKL